MVNRGELDVALDTSNLVLVGIWVTTLGSIPIAAFLLDIDLSERLSKSDLKARPVMIKGSTTCTDPALNLWAGHLVMKSGDLQSCVVIILGGAYGDHHSAVSQSP